MGDIVRPADLIEWRRRGLERPLASTDLPATVEAAYDFAQATVRTLGRPVAAWKLGATTAATRRAFATEEVYFGALLDSEAWFSESGDAPPAPHRLRGEAEIAFRLACDIPPEESQEILSDGPGQIFDGWAPAIEAPYSCVENLLELGLRALLMDRCAAGALYLGAVRTQMDDPSMMRELEIFAGTDLLAQGSAGDALLMPPIDAARVFLAMAGRDGVDVQRGQWISTGGITPCVALPFGEPVRLVQGGKTVFEVVLQDATR
jgi:2-keto-4-pentenoate hydratase